MYTFEDKLKEYAELLVRVGVNVQKGQDLVITSQVDQAPFARMCVKAAYEAGARSVVVDWGDDAVSRMTFLNAADDVFDSIPEYRVRFNTDYAERNACFLRLVSSDPENLKGVDPGRLERMQRASGRQMKRYRALLMGSAVPWSIGALASPSWGGRGGPVGEDLHGRPGHRRRHRRGEVAAASGEPAAPRGDLERLCLRPAPLL